MRRRFAALLLPLVCALGHAGVPAAPSDTNSVVSRHADVRFARCAPYATPAEVMRRLGITPVGKGYNLAAERFQIIVPGTFSTNSLWGLLVWISPSDVPKIPSAWEVELAQDRLLFVGAYKSGNDRDAVERARLALDAAFNMRQLYRIDSNRIYVAGFSGGGRMASMLGVGYASVFAGTVCVCGANFYKDIPTAGGGFWARAYSPDAGVLALAKGNRRFVLLTGDQDMNRENTRDLWQNGFQREGFSHVRYLEVPGLKHDLPSAEVLRTALEFLTTKEAQRNTAPGNR